jgi:hypothetical protein
LRSLRTDALFGGWLPVVLILLGIMSACVMMIPFVIVIYAILVGIGLVIHIGVTISFVTFSDEVIPVEQKRMTRLWLLALIPVAVLSGFALRNEALLLLMVVPLGIWTMTSGAQRRFCQWSGDDTAGKLARISYEMGRMSILSIVVALSLASMMNLLSAVPGFPVTIDGVLHGMLLIAATVLGLLAFPVIVGLQSGVFMMIARSLAIDLKARAAIERLE